MAKTQMRLQFIGSGFEQILKSEGTRQVVEETTERIRQNAVENYSAIAPDGVNTSAGFSSATKLKPTRWVGFVSTTDEYSAMGESEDKILTRAIT